MWWKKVSVFALSRDSSKGLLPSIAHAERVTVVGNFGNVALEAKNFAQQYFENFVNIYGVRSGAEDQRRLHCLRIPFCLFYNISLVLFAHVARIEPTLGHRNQYGVVLDPYGKCTKNAEEKLA